MFMTLNSQLTVSVNYLCMFDNCSCALLWAYVTVSLENMKSDPGVRSPCKTRSIWACSIFRFLKKDTNLASTYVVD